MNNNCMHKWKYRQHDLVRICKLCSIKEMKTWVQVPYGCEIKVEWTTSSRHYNSVSMDYNSYHWFVNMVQDENNIQDWTVETRT